MLLFSLFVYDKKPWMVLPAVRRLRHLKPHPRSLSMSLSTPPLSIRSILKTSCCEIVYSFSFGRPSLTTTSTRSITEYGEFRQSEYDSLKVYLSPVSQLSSHVMLIQSSTKSIPSLLPFLISKSFIRTARKNPHSSFFLPCFTAMVSFCLNKMSH